MNMLSSSLKWLITLLFLLLVAGGYPVLAKMQDRTFNASGSITNAGAEGCELSVDGCFLTLEGTIQGQGIGNGSYITTLIVQWGAALDNSSAGSQCAPASGETIFTTADGSEVTLGYAGFICELLSDANPTPQTFNGSFIVTDANKRFSGVQGSGRITFSIESDGHSLMHIQGVFQ